MHSMKNILLILAFSLFSNLGRAANSVHSSIIELGDSTPKKVVTPIPQKEKLYCSPWAKTKYKVLITGSKIKITRLYKEYVDVITGNWKNGKIYSNDPAEKGLKALSGKYYKLKGSTFSVLNIENGEYEAFILCKE